jgi:hypothetical protein
MAEFREEVHDAVDEHDELSDSAMADALESIAEELRSNNDDTESRAKRVTAAERARVMALSKLLTPSTHAMVLQAIADGTPVAEFIPQWLEAMQPLLPDNDGSQQAARMADAQALNGVRSGDAPNGSTAKPVLGKMLADKTKARARGHDTRGLRRTATN